MTDHAAQEQQPPELGRRQLFSRRGLAALITSCVPVAPPSPRALARQRALAALEERKARETDQPGAEADDAALGSERARGSCW